MPWENIESRLAKAFSEKVAYPGGTVTYPARRLDIDEWLTSAANSDEELRELEIPRVRFLQNHWRLEALVQFEWEGPSFATRRFLWAMYVDRTAYLLFSGGFKYWLVAAIDPLDKAALYRSAIAKLVRSPELVPKRPDRIRYFRPDLEPGAGEIAVDSNSSANTVQKQSFLHRLFQGWIGPWIELPAVGYWQEDDPSFFSDTHH